MTLFTPTTTPSLARRCVSVFYNNNGKPPRPARSSSTRINISFRSGSKRYSTPKDINHTLSPSFKLMLPSLASSISPSKGHTRMIRARTTTARRPATIPATQQCKRQKALFQLIEDAPAMPCSSLLLSPSTTSPAPRSTATASTAIRHIDSPRSVIRLLPRRISDPNFYSFKKGVAVGAKYASSQRVLFSADASY